MLQAALLGGQKQYALGPMETGDGFDRTDAKQGAAQDLKRAMNDLEADTVLGDAVGRDLVENHIFMKRKEVIKTRDLEGDGLLDFCVYPP